MFTQEEKQHILKLIGASRYTGTEAEIRYMMELNDSIREKLQESQSGDGKEETPALEE